MAHSFFTANDPELYTASEVFSARINAAYEEYGIPQSAALEYAALNAAWRAAYEAIKDPKFRTTSKICAKNDARERVRIAAARLAKRIAGNRPNVTDAMLIDLGLNVRAESSPMPPPGKPGSFRLTVRGDGSVELRWKCKHPRRAAGATYQVFRRDVPDQPFAYLGTTGKRSFIDRTLPAGMSAITYRVRAIRPTAAGESADFNVNFGTSAPRQDAFNFQPRARKLAA